MLADGFALGEPALADPLDTLSSLGGTAALERDAGAAGSEPAGEGAGSAGSAGAAGAAGATEQAGDGGAFGTEDGGADADSCLNGRIDPGEQGIDCGGACPACETCSDGIRNQDEAQVDCGGVCPACVCVWTPFGAPEKLTGLGFAAASSQWGPALSPDASTMILSNSAGAVAEDLYQATRPDRGAAFSLASALTNLNTGAGEGTPFFSFDGLRLYFYSARAGGLGGRDIYVSARPSLLDALGSPNLVAGVNSSSADHMPWVSPDELRMYFTSNRAPSEGGYDLFVATRSTPSGTFANVHPLSELDTVSSDEGASLTADELTVFFCSNRSNGAGKFDIWMSTRATKTGTFSAPVDAPVVNTAADELNVAVSADGRELFFSSDRGVATTPPHVIWRSIRSCQ